MPFSDIQLVFQWWTALFLVGVAAFPLTKRLFSNWYDRGYFFSKAVGMAVVSYMVFFLGIVHVPPFTFVTILAAMAILFAFGIVVSDRTYWTDKTKKITQFFSFARRGLAKLILCIALEEVFFFSALLFWSWVKAHEPSIRGLEKFMDYGFMQSILNSTWFPPHDMWWAGGFINYYYFGHFVTAVLTRLSGLDLSVTFNLMLATIFALTLTMSFSIGFQLRNKMNKKNEKGEEKKAIFQALFAGGLTSFLVTLAGNMQTLYAFTKGYIGENVVPFWTILWSPMEFFSGVGDGLEKYWYANATRFIPFTIHEFPSYSFVVSDVHGHVLSLPFVLLAIAILIVLGEKLFDRRSDMGYELRVMRKAQTHLSYLIPHIPYLIFYGFLLGILLMTNALDGPIYFGLLGAILVISNIKYQISNILASPAGGQIKNQKEENISWWDSWKGCLLLLAATLCVAGLIALPFLWHFKSFATGIGVNCPLSFLADTKIGPFIFEGAEKCQKSPLWMMELLWGFFWYTGIWLFIKRIWQKEEYDSPMNRILKVFYIFGLVLIIIPEFFYVKDIYPAHFRSNTMFKLGYQAFILWSIVAGYVIVHFIFQRHDPISNIKNQISKIHIKYQKLRIIFFILLIPQLFLVSIYPIFSVRSYFGELKTYKSIYGLDWLEKEFPDDYAAISWLKYQISNIKYQRNTNKLPVIVEADGESYTDYNHVSAFSGVPTIVGWAVHEWLWRGSYDVVAPRREEVRLIYESDDIDEVQSILTKYQVTYIIVGKLEREKFKGLRDGRIASLGNPVFQSGDTVVYDVGKQNE